MTEWSDADMGLLTAVLAARSMDVSVDPDLAALHDDLLASHRKRRRRNAVALAGRQQRVAELARAAFSSAEITLFLDDDLVSLRTVESDLAAIRDVLGEGEILAKTVRKSGQGRPEKASRDVTLPKLGITRMQSSRWQAVASVPGLVFEGHVA
jgi:hypothetical protein